MTHPTNNVFTSETSLRLSRSIEEESRVLSALSFSEELLSLCEHPHGVPLQAGMGHIKWIPLS